MNAGAAEARGELLLFLHADTRLPERGLELAARALLEDEGLAGGAFGLRFDSERPILRVFSRLADWRNRLTRTPYGDQAQFFRSDVFRGLGGYPELPLMEDVAIMRRLRREGLRIRILGAVVRTSARRYEEEGVWFTALRNTMLRLAFALGAPAERLARFYRMQRRKI